MSFTAPVAAQMLISITAAAAYLLFYVRRPPSLNRTVIKTLAIAALAALAVIMDGPWLLVAALALSALGDLFISRDGEAAFLVRFAPKQTIEAVEAAALQAGLTPTLIEAQSRFQMPPGPTASPSALVTVADHWWTLIYRNAATPEAHVRSDWRGADADIAGPIARLIRTMSRAEAKLAVTVNAAGAEAAELIGALQSRLAPDSEVFAADPADDRALALMAAVA